MATRASQSVAEDFTAVSSFLKARGVLPSSPAGHILQNAKKIHTATYSLILWRFRLARLSDHSRAFIEEIASDALQILPQVLMGYGKPSKLLTRGIIENTLRHIYYADHPIEFERMNREQKWFITMESLFEYAKIHPIFLATEARFDAIGRLKNLYGELSSGIHGSKVRDLEMRAALNKIKYENEMATRETRYVQRCAESANFLLAMFHRDKVVAFQPEDQKIILRTMPPRARQIWQGL